MGGFHSKTGWLLSCLLALGMLLWVRRSPTFSRDVGTAGEGRPDAASEYENPTIVYLLPLLVNLALTLVTGAAVSSFDLFYPVRAVLVAVVLAWVLPWKRWASGRAGHPAAAAVLLGLIVVPLWLVLTKPSAGVDGTFLQGLAALSPAGKVGSIAARIFGAAILAPVTEELAFRGFLLRRLHATDFDQVSYAEAARRPFPLLVSSIVFGAIHGSFVAGTIAGVVYGLALIPRGRLRDAIAAHVVTNTILIVSAFLTSSWYLIT